MRKILVYLDNCCFNRPYDDQEHLSIFLETQAKLAIQKLDIVELERFIVLLNRNKFDYTEWRKPLFEDTSLEQLALDADGYSRHLTH